MVYDTIIIGGGAAGLSAAIYSGRYGHKTLMIGGNGIEGSTLETWAVENYPGHLKINGPDLVQTMEQQAKNAGVEIIVSEIKSIAKTDKLFKVNYDNQFIEAKTVIYAAGTKRRMLGLPKEEELKGKGVSYCATCDGPLYRDKIVGVIGGGDSAAKAALILAKYSEKVYVIVRKPALRAEPTNIQSLEKNEKIEILYESEITQLIQKDDRLTGIKLEDRKIIDVHGIFIEIGGVPSIDAIKSLDLKLDDSGYIIVDDQFTTSIPGFFAAGDVTNAFGGFRQIVTATAGGSVAAHSSHNYLTKQ